MQGLSDALRLAVPEDGGRRPLLQQLIDARRDELEAAVDQAEAERILQTAPADGVTSQDIDVLIAGLQRFAATANARSDTGHARGGAASSAQPGPGADETASSADAGTDTPATTGQSPSDTPSVETKITSQQATTSIVASSAPAPKDSSLASALLAYAPDLASYRDTVYSLVPTFQSQASKDQQRDTLREELFGKYVSLYQTLGRSSNIEYSGMATIGIRALQAGRIEMANTIFEIINYNTSSSAPLVAVMRGIWRFGLFLSFFTSLIFLALYVMPQYFDSTGNSTLSSIRASIEGDTGKVVLAAFAGCFGGIVSLLLRLSEFETMQKRSKEFMTLTGATLPLVGGISAAVIGSIFSANIINITAGTADGTHGLNPWLFIVIGFLSGFSERFTRSVLSVAESKFGGSDNLQQTRQPTTVLRSDSINLDITKSDNVEYKAT